MNTKQALRYFEYVLTLLLLGFAAYAAVEYTSGTTRHSKASKLETSLCFKIRRDIQ